MLKIILLTLKVNLLIHLPISFGTTVSTMRCPITITLCIDLSKFVGNQKNLFSTNTSVLLMKIYIYSTNKS